MHSRLSLTPQWLPFAPQYHHFHPTPVLAVSLLTLPCHLLSVCPSVFSVGSSLCLSVFQFFCFFVCLSAVCKVSYMSVCLYVSLYVHLHVCLSAFQSFCLFVCLSAACLFEWKVSCMSVFLYDFLSVRLSLVYVHLIYVCLSVFLFVCLSAACLPKRFLVCFVFLYDFLSACLYIPLSVRLYVSLSICLLDFLPFVHSVVLLACCVSFYLFGFICPLLISTSSAVHHLMPYQANAFCHLSHGQCIRGQYIL